MSDQISALFTTKIKEPDLVVDGVHFGRGKVHENEEGTTSKHLTTEINIWKIIQASDNLVKLQKKNEFNSSENYIVEWRSVTEFFHKTSAEVSLCQDNKLYFHWKGEDALKGFSPLPKEIEAENPPVERIVQWAEPPVFLQLFGGTFLVHKSAHPQLPHLYILRGEIEEELHLFEVPLHKSSLRMRTSFLLTIPKDKKMLLWHGASSSVLNRSNIKKIATKVFSWEVFEVEQGEETPTFLELIGSGCKIGNFKKINYTPRLFYLHEMDGIFSIVEVECCHRSHEVTSLPFLQTYLYSAEAPAIFLVDDFDEIWIWHSLHCEQYDNFKNQSFVAAIDYAKRKSKQIQKLVKVQKVTAGFEPDNFKQLFPFWKEPEVHGKYLKMQVSLLQGEETLIITPDS